MGSTGPVRFTTWLAPGLPEALFDVIAASIGRELGRPYQLTVDSSVSGPTSPAEDRFARGGTDIGFLCPPSYLWLRHQQPPSVALVPVAPVFDDPRNEGRPVYFSDVVVRADSPVSSLDDLVGQRLGYNDAASLSGYFCLVGGLTRAGHDLTRFDLRPMGSHAGALAGIAAGTIDAAAIDAYTWRNWTGPHRGEGLRSAFALGPHPIQPIVVRSELAGELVPAITRALGRAPLGADLRRFGVTGFAPVADTDYEAVRPLLAPTRTPTSG